MASSETKLRRRPISSTKRGKLDGAKPASLNPQYLLQLEKVDEAVMTYILQQMKSQNLSCQILEHGTDRFIMVTSDLNVLLRQAEKLKWTKPLENSEEIIEFSFDKSSEFQPSDGSNLFNSAEQVQLLYHVIQETPYNTDVFNKYKYNLQGQTGFLTALLNSNPPVIAEAYPLHSQDARKELSTMWKSSFIPFSGMNIDKIRNYFGEDVAFYFGWMNFYSTYMIVPAVLGLVMYMFRPSGITVDTDPYLPFFSVFMAIWAVLFVVYWQRQSAVYSFLWNTYDYSASEEIRPEYHGSICTDPITKKPTVYYPGWKRRLWYCVSILAMLPLLSLGVCVMTLSLNLNGYVKNTESPIYVESLAKFAKPGGLFAGDSPYYLWLVPTLAHSITVSIINMLYSKVAEKCTDLENHRTVSRWHSSLVVKRVFFECFDCFMPLFYIAFYQLDVITLRAEIVSLFMSDEIRRVLVETVIPFAKELFISGVEKKRGRKGLIPDTILAEYDQFDDYLEMVIQFGYITLFASAFPLGAAVTLLFLYMEVRSDFFKLLHAYRRPQPRMACNIGVWYDVMRAMVFVSILTNCVILGFSSEQLMQWLPSLFARDSADGDQVMALGSGRYVVGTVFGFEHLLLVVAVWLQWAIKPEPKWVRLAVARREYLARERRRGEYKKEEEGKQITEEERDKDD